MRLNKVILLLGRRGCGKTTYIKMLIKAALKTKKSILIVDTFDHPAYELVPRIHPKDIKNIRSGQIVRVFGSETDEILAACENFYNGLLIFEDATKFIGKSLQKPVRRMVVDTKQKNVDLIFLFHGFVACPPELFRNADELILMDTGDKPETRKDCIPFDDVLKAYNASKNDIKIGVNKYPARRIILN